MSEIFVEKRPQVRILQISALEPRGFIRWRDGFRAVLLYGASCETKDERANRDLQLCPVHVLPLLFRPVAALLL